MTPPEADLHERLQWAGRAMQLASEVNDSTRIDAVIQGVVKLAQKSDARRAWRFALACTFGSKRVAPSEELRRVVLSEITRQVDAELASERVLPFQGNEASLDLMEHYWRSGDRVRAQDLAKRYMAACLPACRDAAAMLASSWLTKLHNLLTSYELESESREIAVLLEKRSKEIQNEFATVRHEQEVNMGPTNDLIDEILKLPMQDALAAVWVAFTPRVELVRQQGERMHAGFRAVSR